MEAFLHDTGDPHLGIPCVHVGGTNGKGSVASTVATVLDSAGHRAGLYTSPHLCSFRERFQIRGVPVGDDELRELVRELDPEIRRHSLTFFEAATGLAFHLFRNREVAVSVIEVGLGGRLDATNVVTPFLTAITNVDLDHCDYLGSSLDEIAREKAGIIKSGVPLLTSEPDDRIRSVLAATCDALGAPFIDVGSDPGEMSVEVRKDHTTFDVATEAPGVWLLTLAAEGATIFDRRSGDVESTHLAAPLIDVVDPTGAGDAFGAGYVCAWLNGAEPDDATRAGVRSGSVACASAGVPSLAAFQKGLLSLI